MSLPKFSKKTRSLIPLLTVIPLAAGSTHAQIGPPPVQDQVPAATATVSPVAQPKPFITIDEPIAEDQDVLNVSQTSKQAPALLAKTSTGIPLAARFFLRQPVQDSGNYFTEANVGTYVDGVYYARPYGALFDFIDIDQIAVLPQAQGELFGRNTIDGAILITTKQPGNQFAATGDVTYGTKNFFDLRGAISAPIVEDKLYGSISGLSRQRDGLVEATNLNKDVDNRNYQAARAKLVFTPTEAYDLTLSIDGLHDRSSPKYPSTLAPFAAGQDPAANPNRNIFVTEATTPDLNRVDQEGAAIVQNYRLDNFTIKSITGFRNVASTNYVTYDADPANVLSTESFVHQAKLTQDLSISGGTDTLKGTLGVYYLRKDTGQWTPTGGSPSFSHEVDNSLSGYGEVTESIIPGVDLVGGLRYTVEDKDFASDFYAGNKKATRFGIAKAITASQVSPQTDSNTWYGFTPKFGINVEIAPDVLGYFSYTKGFKSGGWNNRLPPNYDGAGNIDLRPLRYLPETAEEYEVGLKTAFLDNKIQLNVSAYRHDYTNLQIPVLLYGSSTSYLTTAPAAEIDGIEIDPTWQVTKEFEIYGLGALQHARYQGQFLCQNTAGVEVNCSGDKLIGLAPFRAVVGLVYAPELPLPGQLRFGLSVNYSDKYENSVLGVDLAATSSHSLVDASVNYDLPGSHWTFSLEGRNLTNVQWFATAVQDGPAVAVYPDDPRTILGRIRYRY